jgi:hypothetical protein
MLKWIKSIFYLVYLKFVKTEITVFDEKYYHESKNAWFKEGSTIPAPEAVKRAIIIDYFNQYKYEVLVETGTFMGGTVEALSNKFKNLYTIELSKMLYLISKERLKSINNIQFLFGNSIDVLPKVLTKVSKPAIIWLDGHYSGGITAKGDSECPIIGELNAIKQFGKNLNHIILIDDIRCFDGLGDYPSVEKLKEEIIKINSNYQITVQDDILRAVLKL